MDRRRFLKYAGTGAVAVGAGAAAYYLYNARLGVGPVVTTAHTQESTSNTTQSLPELRVSCTPDKNTSLRDLVFLDDRLFQPSASVAGAVEPLTIAWYLDDYANPISTQTKPDPIALAPGEHYLRLVVTDGAGRREEAHLPKIVKVGDRGARPNLPDEAIAHRIQGNEDDGWMERDGMAHTNRHYGRETRHHS